MQEEQWPPAGSTVVEEQTQDDQWPPKGSQSIESSEPTEEQPKPAETIEAPEQGPPELTVQEVVDQDISSLESSLYDSKAVQAANAKAEELAAAKAAQEEYEGSARTKRLQDEKLQKDKEYQKSLQKGGYIDKSFDYKHVEITQPDGSVKTYPYSQVQSNYGDVDEYVKRFQGKARIVDTTPPEEQEAQGFVDGQDQISAEVQAKMDKDAEDRKKRIAQLEKEKTSRENQLSSLEAKKLYKQEYIDSKELSRELNAIDETSDYFKEHLGRKVYEDLSEAIDAESMLGFDEDELIELVENDDPEGKQYLDKFFGGDKAFYDKWKKYYDSDGEDYDFEWTKNYIGDNNVRRYIDDAKSKKTEEYHFTKEHDSRTRRRIDEFLAEDLVGVDALAEARKAHNAETQRLQEIGQDFVVTENRGKKIYSRKVNKVRDEFGLLQREDIAVTGDLYGYEGNSEGSTEAGQYGVNTPLSREELNALKLKAEGQIQKTNILLNEDFQTYEREAAELKADYAPYEQEINSAMETIKRIEAQGISANSPTDVIDEYNAAIQTVKDQQALIISDGLQARETELIDTYKQLQNRNNVLMAQADKTKNLSIAVDGALKNYSNLDRMGIQLEKGFLGTGSMLGGSIMKGVGDAMAWTLDKFELADDETIQDLYNQGQKIKGAAVDYNQELNESLSNNYIRDIEFRDASWSTLDTYMGQMFANNSPSILTTMLTLPAGGFGGLASGAARGTVAYRVAAMRAQMQASRLSQGLFFMQGYGGKMADLEVTTLNADQKIADLNKMIESAGTEYEKLSYQTQLNELNRQVSLPQWKRTTSAMIGGLSDMYMEKLGSLSYVNKFTSISPITGASTFKKLMYNGLNTGLNLSKEIGEEVGVQIINNASDNIFLGEDKSLLDGINEDFLVNTAFTSLAIQGPGMGSNAYNIFADEVKNQADRKATIKRRNELFDIENQLANNRSTMSKADQRQLVDRKREIIAEEAMSDVMTTQKLARMSTSEKKALFEINRKRRKALNNIRNEAAKGSSKSSRDRKNKLVAEYKKLDDQRNELLTREKRNRQEKAKDNFDEAQYQYNMGLNDFYTDVVELNQYKNGNKLVKFTNENPPNQEQLSKDYSPSQAKAIVEAYNKGSNALNIPGTNDIMLFQRNIDANMSNTQNATESEIAAVAPMHELLHIQNRKAGIVKDGVVVSQANVAIKQLDNTMKENLSLNKITQEQYDNFVARKKLYTNESGVNVEELLNLYGDFVNIGVLTPSSLNGMYGIKNTLSALVNKFNPTNQAWLFPMKTGKDVFGYLNSFQKQARNMNVAIDEEERDEGVLEQSSLQQMSEGFDMTTPRGRTAFINEKLSKDQDGNFVTDITQSELGKDIGGIVESTTRRLYDKVPEDLKRGISRDDFKNDLTTLASTLIQQEFDPTKQDLDKFLSNRLNLRANKLATDTFGQDFTDDITEARDIAAEEVEPAVESRDNRKIDASQRGIKLKDRLAVNEAEKETLDQALENIKSQVDDLPVDQLNFKTLRRLATDEVQRLFGVEPKPGNLTKQDVANAQAFINKNVDALMTMLPEGATPSGTSTGVQKVLLDKLYNKTDRAIASKTGSKAGLPIQQKRNNITQAQFKEIFGITPAGTPNISDRNTSARIKAIIDQTERMLTNQEVRAELQKRGRDVPSALAEGKAEVMFSASLNEISQEQLDLYNEISNARSINDVAKILGLGKITISDDNRVEKQAGILKAIRDYGLSTNVFKAAMPASAGATRFRVGKAVSLDTYLADNNIKGVKGDVWYKLTNGKFAKGVYKGTNKNGVKQFDPPVDSKGVPLTNLVPTRGRLYYGVTDPAYITALESTIPDKQKPKRIRVKGKLTKAQYDKNKAQSDMNMDILEDVSMQLNDAVAQGMDPTLAAVIIAQGYQATAGLIKIAAPFTNVSNTFEYGPADSKAGQRTGEKFREEHNPPASVIGASLIAAITQNKVAEIFPFIRQNYSQTQLSKADDHKLDMAKLDATLPDGFSIFNNPAIRLAEAGINLNSITSLETGQTIAEQIGIEVPQEFTNIPDVIALQNEQVKLIDQGKTIDQAKADIDAFLPLAQPMKAAADVTTAELLESKVLNVTENMTTEDLLSKAATIDEALRLARQGKKKIRKIRVFDFDDTLARSNSLVFYTKENGEQGQLTAEQFAKRGAELIADGAVMDFSDFNIVREGQRGPLFEVAQKIKEARGNEDLFVLTARAPQAQEAIYEFLKQEGLEFKKENIVGLGNSTGEAKANWLLDKAAEGYNDFYFADDAYQNVKAVRDVMEVVDVKSKVQQAIINESKNLNSDFNKILENRSGIGKEKTYSKAKAKVVGSRVGGFKFFIPYSAEDFQGLIYKTLAKGKLGEQQMAWYKKNLLDPYARAMDNLSKARLQLMQDFNALKKQLNVPANLRKTNESGFTNEQAVRVYLWNKTGQTVPGLSQTDLKELVDVVENNSVLKTFADQILTITKGDGYSNPGDSWLAGTITTDLIDLINDVKRPKYLAEWQQNADEIFSEQNLNKLEAIYGAKYREAMEDILRRMKSGKNRSFTGSRLSNRILDYINASNGAIMFFNMRSAILQTISSINFMNWSFNNPLKAGRAFANQPQYWKDFKTLMNSDYLVDRRNGLRINISESEIADAAKTSGNKAKAVLNYILQKGFLPTQFADSFAIASGGATFYRNRINDLMKNEGMTEAEASTIAMQEFREISEESQQSSRPDKISQQQASDLGRLILMFANTPMQYARLQKRALQDLISGRGDAKSNVSKVLYYAVVQNLIFNALQQAVFALGFGDDDEDEKEHDKYFDTANGMADSFLRGLGIGGATISVVKNFLLDIYERSGRSRPEYVDSVWKLLQFSPPISSKISKIRQALWQFNSKKRREQIMEMGPFNIDNPAYEAGAKVVSATTNIPLDRVLQKYDNISQAMAEETEWWQTIAMLAGWPGWQLGVEDQDTVKTGSKSKSKVKTKKRKIKKRKVKR